ncbi:Uncharacterised protein [Mycobacteroides abscessus subsp. abscessus]|nr:hypothetical protein PROPHIT493_25 [Mycobacterium phage prophiT49-3]WJJ56640.1 hypothetical protein PROPHIBWHA1_24 [Mycobacterium phage prophiBWHA-1]SIE08610.1 Uncharacterised protein [Mycobacteroides abscessus subsp. abscessus]SIF98516.1 Uncharacterised protein [Mycobacteroides abscessus subsp. abscessus]SKW93597.1 Uncharacterised protein [Mycobacteroides abscessus subsp. abscessus]
MTDRAFVVLPKPGSVRRRVDNPFAGSEEVAPLPPKRRENTYRDEAMQDWVFGLRRFLVASYGGVFQRFDNDGADGWGTLERISWPDNPYLPDGQSVAV